MARSLRHLSVRGLCGAAALLALAWMAHGSAPDGRGVDLAPLFDVGPEGEIWARGADYKARFDEGGMTFIPFLGSHAPRNFPVAFASPEARLGGAPLAVSATAEPARSGLAVRYDRGPLVEEFRIDAGAVEQLFHFGRLPAAGDLVVRVTFESELVPRQVGTEIVFEGAFGGVRYGEAVALDERGELLRTAPRLEDGALEIRIPSAVLARTRGALTIDPLISTFDIEVSAPDDRNSDVAYDASLDVYAVVWQRIFSQSDSDAHGKLLDASGNVLQQFLIDVTTENANDPQIAGIDALDQFCTLHRTGTTQGSLIARLLDATGGVISVGAPILAYQDNSTSHALGGDATGSPPHAYLFATPWNSSLPVYLDYGFISPTGQLGPFGFFEDNWDGGFLNPRIAKSAWVSSGGQKRWILGFEWWDLFLFLDPRAVMIAPNTAAGDWVKLDVGNRLGGVSTPLEADDDQPTYLAVGSGSAENPSAVQARLVRGDVALGTSLTVAAGPSADARVGTDGSSFVVSYTSLDQPGTSERVWAASLELSGNSVAASEQVPISADGSVARRPALVSTRKLGGAHRRFLVAWHRLTAGNGDILGALYDTPGVGVRYCTGAPNSVGPGARIEATGSISIAANAFQLSASGCPPSVPGMFYLGQNQTQFPFGEGYRCIGGDTARIFPTVTTDPQGEAGLTLDFGQHYGSLVLPGPPGISYQFWYRDSPGGPAGFNLSDALRVQHTP